MPPRAPATGSAAKPCPAASPDPVRTAPGAGKTVALTFDDGPGPETPRVLKILRDHDVRATFYVLGSQTAIWPAYAQQLVAEGHQLGNHSWDHPDFAGLSASAQKGQLDRGTRQLVKATGVRPCTFRPPFGSLGRGTTSIAAGRRMRTVLWTTDTNDWAAGTRRNPAGREDLRRRARTGTQHRHPVVLLHDGGHFRPNMVAELPELIRWYRSHGYRFVDMTGRSGVKSLTPEQKAGLVRYQRSPTGFATRFAAGPGSITIRGWAKDPDSGKKLRIRVQEDDRWSPRSTTAGRDLEDVAGPAGAHEFTVTLPAARGHHTVCAFADNIGPGTTAGLGCQELDVR